MLGEDRENQKGRGETPFETESSLGLERGDGFGFILKNGDVHIKASHLEGLCVFRL